MPKIWLMSDEVRSEIAIAAIDARVHVGLALERVKMLAGVTPLSDLTQLDGWLSHAHGTLGRLDAVLREKVAAAKGDATDR